MTIANRTDRVSNSRLRQEFLRRRKSEGLTAELVAIRLGWECSGRPDNGRVLKNLGIKLERSNGRDYRWTTCSYERAVELADGIGLDPFEVGL